MIRLHLMHKLMNVILIFLNVEVGFGAGVCTLEALWEGLKFAQMLGNWSECLSRFDVEVSKASILNVWAM
jgi:hypothetical protein